jgi:hypothetical protein
MCLFMCLCMCVVGISVSSSYWLSFWSAHRNEHSAWFYLGIYILINGIILGTISIRWVLAENKGGRGRRRETRGVLLLQLMCLCVCMSVSVFVCVSMCDRDLYTALVGWRAAKSLFASMVISTLHAPMSFFGTGYPSISVS